MSGTTAPTLAKPASPAPQAGAPPNPASWAQARAAAPSAPQAAAPTAAPAAGAPPIGTDRPVSVPARPGDTPRAVLDRGYAAMARQAGLSPAATQEFVRRAPGLDGGQVHGPSADPRQTGPALSPEALRTQAAAGQVTLAPTAAQSGLLHLLQAQDASRTSDIPSGAAAGLPGLRGAPPGVPGNGAVTPQIAAELLRNVTEGRPPFRPEMGQVGPVSWFVTGGNPHTGTAADKSVTVPVEVSSPTGQPPLRFGEQQLLEIYNAKLADATALAESEVRAKNGRTSGEPLNSRMRSDIAFKARGIAERAMWTEVGNRVAASPSGVGVVELVDSTFSRSGNGEFTLTSRPEAVRIRGGAAALLDVIRTNAAPAEPGVLEAAERLAATEGWGGRVQGAFRVGGKVLIVVGALADGYKIYTATDKPKAIAEVAGGWAGATAAGSAFAAWFAPADVAGPWAWAAHGVGTLAAGAFGYWAGSNATRIVYELAVEGRPITVGP